MDVARRTTAGAVARPARSYAGDVTAAPATSQLTVRTVAINDPGPLIDLLPSPQSLAWVRGGEGMVGWGRIAGWEGVGADRFADAEAWWRMISTHSVVRDEISIPGSGLVAFGSFAFADGPSVSRLIVPEVVVGHRGDVWWMTTVATGGTMPPLPELDQWAHTEVCPTSLRWGPAEGAIDEWKQSVREAVERISSGELDKVVLSRHVTAQGNDVIDPRAPLQRLATEFESCWTFSVDGLIGATPEMLVRLTGSLATSRVLAGTIRRTGDDERDVALAATLARSSKDLEEHEYAVRSVAQALAPHCTGMNVPETPFVLHLPNVMHLASDVTGVIRDGSSSLHLAAALHPSAAVGGTPTDRAVALIAELEPSGRGRFSGPVGWVDASGDGEWGIALRCGEIDADDQTVIRLHAGCGIVADSDPDAEWAESEAKLSAMRSALR
jgi:menaquinone-specific isochorismate synthase